MSRVLPILFNTEMVQAILNDKKLVHEESLRKFHQKPTV